MDGLSRYIFLVKLFVTLWTSWPPLASAINTLVTTPGDFTAIDGESVTLTCSVDELEVGNAILWIKNNVPISLGSQVFIIPGLIDATRTSVIQNGLVAELSILNVTTFDEGLYQCCVRGISGGQCIDTSPTASITVIINGPKCVLESDNVIEGQNISMLCQAKNGDPLVALLWQGADSGEIADSIFWTDSEYSYLRTYWTPNRNDTDIDYVCIMSQDNIEEGRCTLGPFDIQYPPTVEIVPSKHTVTSPQETITFHCNVNANPSVNEFWWSFNDILLNFIAEPEGFTINGNIIEVFKFEQSDNGTVVKCAVSNDVGSGIADAIIIIDGLTVTGHTTSPRPNTDTTPRIDNLETTRTTISTSTTAVGDDGSAEKQDSTLIYIVAGAIASSFVLSIIFAVILITFVKANRRKKQRRHEESLSSEGNFYLAERSVDNPIAGFCDTEFEMTEKPNGYVPNSEDPELDDVFDENKLDESDDAKSATPDASELHAEAGGASEDDSSSKITKSEYDVPRDIPIPSHYAIPRKTSESSQMESPRTDDEKTKENQYDNLENALSGDKSEKDDPRKKNAEGLVYADLLLTNKASNDGEIRRSQAMDPDVTYAEVKIKK